jgi:hypothetical protein
VGVSVPCGSYRTKLTHAVALPHVVLVFFELPTVTIHWDVAGEEAREGARNEICKLWAKMSSAWGRVGMCAIVMVMEGVFVGVGHALL